MEELTISFGGDKMVDSSVPDYLLASAWFKSDMSKGFKTIYHRKQHVLFNYLEQDVTYNVILMSHKRKVKQFTEYTVTQEFYKDNDLKARVISTFLEVAHAYQ